MKRTAGLWIDHRKAIIVVISDKGEETKVIESKVERQQGRFEGKRSVDPYEAQMAPMAIVLPELIKRLENNRLGGLVEAVETADAMTDGQIAAKVREYFQK